MEGLRHLPEHNKYLVCFKFKTSVTVTLHRDPHGHLYKNFGAGSSREEGNMKIPYADREAEGHRDWVRPGDCLLPVM